MPKWLLINVNMEDQDVGVVDPRFHHGMPWHSQNLLGLAGHSMPLMDLHIPSLLHKAALAVQMSLKRLETSQMLGNLWWP